VDDHALAVDVGDLQPRQCQSVVQTLHVQSTVKGKML
jgi:hypothetical protein